MEILTREGRSSWFPSGVYFSRVNRVSVFSFSAFLLRRRAAFAPCFDHFLSDTSSGSAITSHSGCVWRETKNEVRLLRGRSRAHTKGQLLGPAWWCGEGIEEGVLWMPRWGRGWWHTAIREEGAGLANERRSARKGCSQRGPRNLVVKDSPRYQCCHTWCSNGGCFRWGQKEEFIGLWIKGLPQDSGKENEVWWLGKVIFASYLASMFIAEKVEKLGRNGVAEWMALVRLMQMAQK